MQTYHKDPVGKPFDPDLYKKCEACIGPSFLFLSDLFRPLFLSASCAVYRLFVPVFHTFIRRSFNIFWGYFYMSNDRQ